jgi:signal transduction histidine kinase
MFRIPPNLGQWALSYRFWLGVTILRMPILDQRFFADHNDYISQKLPTLIISALVSGIPIYLASVTLPKDRLTEIPNLAWTVLAWMLSDIALTVTGVLLLGKNQLRSERIASPVSMLVHAAGSIPTGAMALFAVCLFFLGRSRTRDLMVSVDRQAALLARADAYRDSISKTFSKQVENTILPGFERIKSEVASLAESRMVRGKLQDFASRINDFSIGQVRGLSHQIANSQIYEIDKFMMRAESVVESKGFASEVFKPANPALTFWFFLMFGTIVKPELPFWVVAIESIVVWCASDVCARFYKIFGETNLFIRTLIMFLSLGAPVLLMTLTDLAVNPNFHRDSNILFTAVVVCFSTAFSYPFRFYAEVNAELESINTQTSKLVATVRQDAENIRDNFSNFVHGKVQGRLALVSFILAQISSGEVSGRAKAKQVARLVQIFDTIESEIRAMSKHNSGKSILETTKRLQTEWSGLVVINVETKTGVEQWLEENPSKESQAAGIVEESVLNARIHGEASELTISLSLDGSDSNRLRLEIVDNGKGIKPKRLPGLGSRQLTAICESWSLIRTKRKLTKLTAVIVGDAS